MFHDKFHLLSPECYTLLDTEITNYTLMKKINVIGKYTNVYIKAQRRKHPNQP